MSELLRLTSELPDVVDSPSSLHRAVEQLAQASGPIGVDAERAGSYRYPNVPTSCRCIAAAPGATAGSGRDR